MCSWWSFFCFFKQKTAYEMRISDWSSDVCSSDLEFVESVGRMALDHAGEHIAEPGIGFDAVELGGLDQRANHGPAMTAAVASGEQMVFPAECHRTDGAFDRLGVEFDADVVEEAGQAGPPSESIADGAIGRAACRERGGQEG